MPLVQPTNVQASDGDLSNGTLVTWSYPGTASEVLRWDIYRWQPGEAPQFHSSAFGSSTSSFLDTEGQAPSTTTQSHRIHTCSGLAR